MAASALLVSLVLLSSLFTAIKSNKVDNHNTSRTSRNIDYLQVGTKFTTITTLYLLILGIILLYYNPSAPIRMKWSSKIWIGIHLTRQARRRMNRGYQTLLVSKLRRGEYLHKDAFVEITTTDNTEVGHNTLWLFTHSSSPQGEKVGRPSMLILAMIARVGRPLAAWVASP